MYLTTFSLFRTFIEETSEAEKSKASHSLGVVEEKLTRTQVHQAIKLMEGLRTETVNGEIVVEFCKKRSQTRRDDDWPPGAPSFLHFVLLKTNQDTSRCLAEMTEKLKCKHSRFTIAGTKDRRAITTQRVSVFKVPPERLIRATKNMMGISIGNYSIEKDPIRLGDLHGNRFSIVLRFVPPLKCALPL